MLQLKHKPASFELTDRTTTVELADKDIKVGGELYGEPGEYETNNIEIVYGEQAALVVWEHLQIVYVFSVQTPGVFEKDQFSSSDVVIIGDNLPEINKATLDELLAIYDPKIVIMSSQARLEESLKTSLKLQENNALKLTKANLPEEGRDFYLAG